MKRLFISLTFLLVAATFTVANYPWEEFIVYKTYVETENEIIEIHHLENIHYQERVGSRDFPYQFTGTKCQKPAINCMDEVVVKPKPVRIAIQPIY